MKCILISSLLIILCGFALEEIWALRCITTDGLQAEEVRRIVKKCMKKVTSSGGSDDVKNYDEYENFENVDYEMKDNNGGSRDTNNDRMSGNNNNYNPRFNQYDSRSSQTGGNYYEMNRPRNDGHDSWMQQQPQQFNPYQQPPSSYSSNNRLAYNQRSDFYGYQNNNKNSNNDNSTSSSSSSSSDKHERDRSCILQCFFQELKMVMNSCLFIRVLINLEKNCS